MVAGVRIAVEGVCMNEEPSVRETREQGHDPLGATLLTTSEGRLLLAGVAVALGYALWLGVKVLYDPVEAQILIGVTATAATFGRAAGLAFGYSFGLPHVTVMLICMVVETIFVLTFYPLFVFSWRHLLIVRRLKKPLERIHEAAEVHRHTIQKYGIIGLFAFVWFPFWMTGAVVGSAIGFLLGFPAWLTILVVLGGTYMAIFSWAMFMHYFHQQATAYSTYAPVVLMAALTIVLIAGHFLQRTLHERRNRTRSR
jgi:uncharacterized membrane protein